MPSLKSTIYWIFVVVGDMASPCHAKTWLLWWSLPCSFFQALQGLFVGFSWYPDAFIFCFVQWPFFLTAFPDGGLSFHPNLVPGCPANIIISTI
jgi:hypothetical protein